jgi:hypothetical protein
LRERAAVDAAAVGRGHLNPERGGSIDGGAAEREARRKGGSKARSAIFFA